MGILRVFFGEDARWRVFFGDPYCDDLERILMLERVDTRHRKRVSSKAGAGQARDGRQARQELSAGEFTDEIVHTRCDPLLVAHFVAPGVAPE
jgi:hypothetical protein